MTDTDHQQQTMHPDEVAEGRAAEAALYARLGALGIAWSHHDHPPLMTVADSQELCGDLPGAHVKNLFLKDKKGQLWLVTCLEHRQFRIRDLERAIGAKGASFGKPDLLWQVLGVRPGAVTPFAALNAAPDAIRLVLDQGIAAHPAVNAHPLHNRATTAVAWVDLLRFLEALGHVPVLLDFDTVDAAGRQAPAP
ncbi:MAG: prolyl-tRNA synthetase associated domain-containing protein [Pseudomonadota bacterium]